MKKHIITVAGDLASGKGTVTKLLGDDLGYEIYRNGEYFRKLAKEKNMGVTEFNEYVTEHPEIDREIEFSASEYARKHDNLIVDARLGWYAVPESYKVYIKVDTDEAARRAFNDEKRKDTENFNTIEEHKQDIIKRFNLENERYFNLYNVRKDDMDNYDFVIDSTDKTPLEVKELILLEYNNWLRERD